MGTKTQREKAFRPAIGLAAILLAAFAARLIFLVQLERSELGGALSLDSQLYYDVAREVAGGGSMPPEEFAFNPLYPSFLIIVFKLFGPGLLAPRILQLAIGLATIALIYIAGRRLAPPSLSAKRSAAAIALLAAAIACLYAEFVIYEGMLIASTLEIFFFAASLSLALAIDDEVTGIRSAKLRKHPIRLRLWCFLLGALCGAGALGRPNLFFLLVAALPVWLVVRLRGWPSGRVPAAAFAAGAALFLAPPILYNAARTGRLVPVTAQGGYSFYIGNMPGNSGFYQPPPEARSSMKGAIEDMRTLASAEAGSEMTIAGASEFYFRKTLRAIGRAPGEWIALLGKKLAYYFAGEVPDMPNVFFYKKVGAVPKLLFLRFQAIAALAACGAVVFLRIGKSRGVVLLFLACGVVSVVAFFVNTRYRLASAPVIILLAAFFLVWTARELGRGRLRYVAVAAAACVLFFLIVSNRPIAGVSNSAAYAFLGNHHLENGNEAEAEAAFAEAYRLAPGKIEAIINYARILRQRGRMSEAAHLFAQAYARSPRFPLVAVEYGMALDRLGLHTEAKELYIEASSADRATERALACRLLARSAMAEGNRNEAIMWIERALADIPGEPELTRMLEQLQSIQ